MSNVIEVCRVAHYAPIEKLKTHPANAELRSISRDRLNDLKDSLINKGFYEPILVWKKGGFVLAGNQRLRAAQELIADGYVFKTPSGKENELPIVIEDVNEERALEILHQSNKHHGDWVERKVAEALRDAEDIKALGWTQEEVDNLIQRTLKDAEEVSRPLPRVDEPLALKKTSPVKEEYDSLMLPVDVMEQLKELLAEVAVILNADWQSGDSLSDAVQVVVQSLRESSFLEEIEKAVQADEEVAVME